MRAKPCRTTLRRRLSPAIPSTSATESAPYALDIATGGQVNASPTLADGLIYFGSKDQNLYVLTTSGHKQWSYQTKGSVTGSAVVYDNTVYVGSYDDRLYALNSADGTYKWSYQTGSHIGSTARIWTTG